MPEDQDYAFESPINEKVETKLCFRIVDIDPDKLTKQLGLQPSHVFRKGKSPDPVNRPKAISKYNSWHLESELPESAEAEDHLGNILKRLDEHRGDIAALSSRYAREFGFTVFTHDRPRFNFPAEILKQVVALGASIDIDGYDVHDNMDEPIRDQFFKRATKLADPLIFSPTVALEVLDWVEEHHLALWCVHADSPSGHHEGMWDYERFDAAKDKTAYAKARKYISIYLDEHDRGISFEVSDNIDGTNQD